MMQVEAGTRPIDPDKAAQPPRAADVYLVASRLKRMMLEVVHVLMSEMEEDRPASIQHIKRFQELSREIEPLLDDLVYQGRTTDG